MSDETATDSAEAITPDDPADEPALEDGAAQPAEPLVLDDDTVRRGVEAILFLADEPVDAATLAEAVEQPPEAVEALVEELAQEHRDQARGTEIRGSAGGWRMYTSPAARPVIERWALAGRTGRLTQAALETLAVIAYKQPISRQEIGDIRGVNADGAVRSLVARGFVEDVGRDPGPGQAVLYGTTRLLLERLGLGSLDELPELTDFLPEAPAPDEPDLSALKDVRRRLAAGGELPSRSIGGRTAEQTNTGTGEDHLDEDADDALPPPERVAGVGHDDAEMDGLTDRLEQAARNAMQRLRSLTDPADDGEPDAGRDAAEEDVAVPEGVGDAAADELSSQPSAEANERAQRGDDEVSDG